MPSRWKSNGRRARQRVGGRGGWRHRYRQAGTGILTLYAMQVGPSHQDCAITVPTAIRVPVIHAPRSCLRLVLSAISFIALALTSAARICARPAIFAAATLPALSPLDGPDLLTFGLKAISSHDPWTPVQELTAQRPPSQSGDGRSTYGLLVIAGAHRVPSTLLTLKAPEILDGPRGRVSREGTSGSLDIVTCLGDVVTRLDGGFSITDLVVAVEQPRDCQTQEQSEADARPRESTHRPRRRRLFVRINQCRQRGPLRKKAARHCHCCQNDDGCCSPTHDVRLQTRSTIASPSCTGWRVHLRLKTNGMMRMVSPHTVAIGSDPLSYQAACCSELPPGARPVRMQGLLGFAGLYTAWAVAQAGWPRRTRHNRLGCRCNHLRRWRSGGAAT